jgi:serine/threonine protein kinase
MIYIITTLLRSRWSEFFPKMPLPQAIHPIVGYGFRCIILLLIKDNDTEPFVVVKTGNDERFIRYEKNDIAAMDYLSTNRRPSTQLSYAKVIYSGYHNNYFVAIKEFLPGETFSTGLYRNHINGSDAANAFAEWLSVMHREHQLSRQYQFTQNDFNEIIQPSIQLFTDTYSLTLQEQAFLDIYAHSAGSSGLPSFLLTLSHGDMTPSNIILRSNVFSAFDWSYVRFNGFPLTDLINFIITYCVIAYPEESKTAPRGFHKIKKYDSYLSRQLLEKIFFSDTPAAHFCHDIILRYCSFLQLPSSLIPFLFITYSIQQPVHELFQLFAEKGGRFIFHDVKK